MLLFLYTSRGAVRFLRVGGAGVLRCALLCAVLTLELELNHHHQLRTLLTDHQPSLTIAFRWRREGEGGRAAPRGFDGLG